MRSTTNRPVHIRASLAAQMARLSIQQPVAVALTGAEWRALAASLTGGTTMKASRFADYVQELVAIDLRRRGIESLPLCAREEVTP